MCRSDGQPKMYGMEPRMKHGLNTERGRGPRMVLSRSFALRPSVGPVGRGSRRAVTHAWFIRGRKVRVRRWCAAAAWIARLALAATTFAPVPEFTLGTALTLGAARGHDLPQERVLRPATADWPG